MPEPLEFITPTSVDIRIDGETWEYTLENAGIPLDTPLNQIKVMRVKT